jgi:hypothetical protein
MFVIAKQDWPECPTHKVVKGGQYEMPELVAKRGIDDGLLEQVSPEKALERLMGGPKVQPTQKRGRGRPRKVQPETDEPTPVDPNTDAA